MALVHEKIYRSKDFARIDFLDYAHNLVNQIFRSLGPPGNVVRAEVKGDPILLNVSTAVPCSLIINELVSNALKHAFPGDRKGSVTVSVSALGDGSFGLVVSDDGVGMPKDFNIARTNSLGLQIVRLLVEQLDGILEVDGRQGARFALTFREAREKSLPSPST